ncbi:MAG TPA: HAMP domain-containing sensor histidine kinase [Acidimicrobiales bacterium]|nr:HAMP domain-containing sensor histidine kinase [Acidimicrobiales bacterium]
MSRARWWRRPHVAHAVRVALVATVVIGAVAVAIVVSFNALDRSRLLDQVAARVEERLTAAVHDPAAAAAIGNYDNAHDADDAPVFFWRVTSAGRVVLTGGAPALTRSSWPAGTTSTVSTLGTGNFLLRAQHVGRGWIVAGQSLAQADHVRSDLEALEAIAGPILLVGVFLGTLLIGVKAAAPVELARRRQLEFTADASHELRTPLSVIEAEVSLALRHERSADDYRQTLGRVSREGRRLRNIVDDLLWLSRFDSEPPPPGDLAVDVAVMAESCSDRFTAVARQSGIELALALDCEHPPLIHAPPEWVERLASVLVDNATRYAGRGGTILITVASQAHRVSLTVEDSGPGIAPEERAHLFDRFHRATDEGNGAGLGLAIGDSVVRATGGEWRVGTSRLGGASMEVRWSRAAGRDSGRRPTASHQEDVATAPRPHNVFTTP